MAETPNEAQRRAAYWNTQIATSAKDARLTRWQRVSQQFYSRYRLESAGLMMGDSAGDGGAQSRMVYNLLWSNVQTLKPMLYSRLPEPYVSRRNGSGSDVERLAATIAERATTGDLERDDFDDQAESLALDYAITGRGTLRVNYEHSIENTRIPIRKEDREDGGPAYFMEDDTPIPRDMVEKDDRGLFVLDPKTTDERAPLIYHNWKDFLIGPGRKWAEVKRDGWIGYRNFMTKPRATKRFGEKVGSRLSYTNSPYATQTAETGATINPEFKSSIALAEVWEIWDAVTEQVIWVSPGFQGLCDVEDDFLKLEGFFNTPRPLMGTYTNDTMIPVPDYAEYHTQAMELDQITAKIEQIVEDIFVGGVYDGTVPSLGNALANKKGGWYPSDNWAALASNGGLGGSVQEFDVQQKAAAVRDLYQHRQAVKKDADELSGMIDLFRGQQTQNDETLGQSEIRKNLGGLRINERQRDFQRYLCDALNLKAQVIVQLFEPERLVQMADLEDLMMQSPQVSRLWHTSQSEQGQQQLQDPRAAMQFQMQMGQARQEQMGKIQAAVGLLRDDRMRSYRLDIETDATVALDEEADMRKSTQFVDGLANYMERVMNSPAVQANPALKALAAEILMFMVRKAHVGRSLEEKVEQTVEDMVSAPQQQPQPDPLMESVKVQGAKVQADAKNDADKNKIDAFEAETDRMNTLIKAQEAKIKSLEAASKADREDLKVAADIIEADEPVIGNGVTGNA